MQLNNNFLTKLNNGSMKYLFTFSTSNWNMFLTTHDTNITYNNIRYKSGVVITNISTSNLSIIDSICIQILNLYNKKPIDTELLLNSNVVIKMYADGLVSDVIFKGFVEQVNKNSDNILNITISSHMMSLKKQTGELFSPLCRACIGDYRCKVQLDEYKSTGKIINIVSDDSFIGNHQLNKLTPSGYYRYGLIKMLSGKLSGLSLQVKDETDGKIWLLKNIKLLKKGDKYEIFPGCDKTMKMCKDKFNNVVNFHGEPFIE